jgi:regulator of replication initiation timing
MDEELFNNISGQLGALALNVAILQSRIAKLEAENKALLMELRDLAPGVNNGTVTTDR